MSIHEDACMNVRGWCELRTKHKLFVWQGVLALRNSSGTVWLMKLINKHRSIDNNCIEIIRFDNNWNLNEVQITSDGYWTCAEVTCFLKSKNKNCDGANHILELYYHCSYPKEGYRLLKFAKRFADELVHDKLEWCSVHLKADMNPFRNLTISQIELKKRKWSLMLKHCTASSFVIKDVFDMLVYDYQL